MLNFYWSNQAYIVNNLPRGALLRHCQRNFETDTLIFASKTFKKQRSNNLEKLVKSWQAQQNR